MKESVFACLVFVVNVFLIVACLYRHAFDAHENQRLHDNILAHQQLEQRYRKVATRLAAVKNPASIEKYAHDFLDLRPVAPGQIKEFPSSPTT